MATSNLLSTHSKEFGSSYSHPALPVLFVLDQVEGAVRVDEAVAAVGGAVGAGLLLQLKGGPPLVAGVGLVVLEEGEEVDYHVNQIY